MMSQSHQVIISGQLQVERLFLIIERMFDAGKTLTLKVKRDNKHGACTTFMGQLQGKAHKHRKNIKGEFTKSIPGNDPFISQNNFKDNKENESL